MSSSKSLICLLVILLCVLSSAFNSVADIPTNEITLLGDGYFQENGAIFLTSSLSSSSSVGVGRAIYNHPIRLRLSSWNSTASFVSSFTFLITPTLTSDSSSSPPLFGDGLTFVITDQPNTVTNGFAVKFDTSFDPSLEDIRDNHLGIDINSVLSVESVNSSTTMGFVLKNGKRTTAWIEYDDSEKILKVWLSYTNSKPVQPILATHCDFSNVSMYLDEFMFVGFTASNRKGTSAKHVIENWVFTTDLPPFGSDTRVIVYCSVCGPDEGYELFLESGIIWMIVALLCLPIYKWFSPDQTADQATSGLVVNDSPDAPSNPNNSLNSDAADSTTTKARRNVVIDQRRLDIEAAIQILYLVGTNERLKLQIERAEEMGAFHCEIQEIRKERNKKLADNRAKSVKLDSEIEKLKSCSCLSFEEVDE
ncbi:hypothetical protein MKW92_031298 [Papaver armeniacum]|nr:hypothetical protein MKW92_031298 [Papaver armeniacum]